MCVRRRRMDHDSWTEEMNKGNKVLTSGILEGIYSLCSNALCVLCVYDKKENVGQNKVGKIK